MTRMLNMGCKRLFIDPGLTDTGWAIFAAHPIGFCHLEESGTLRVHRLPCWTDTVDRMLSEFSRLMNWTFESAYIEFQELWSRSALSHACVARGDLFKLTYLVGRMAQMLTTRNPFITIHLPTPQHWKGQLNARAMKARVEKVFGKNSNRKRTEHEEHALGLYLYSIGGL